MRITAEATIPIPIIDLADLVAYKVDIVRFMAVARERILVERENMMLVVRSNKSIIAGENFVFPKL
jgi:hypothetical protein